MRNPSAKTQYRIGAHDLEVVLAVVRGGTLAAASERLGVDASTVFRAVQRIERGLGRRLFARSRSGYRPLEFAGRLAGHAERLEAELESARSAAQQRPEQVSGTVRITTTDTVLHGLVAPALRSLREVHPLLAYELDTRNELANLTMRDADIAIRATSRPPQHLVGKRVGAIRVALFAAAGSPLESLESVKASRVAWIAPDDALPEHPSVLWRRKHLPKVVPAYRVDSILTVLELVALGLGVGIVPLFLARDRDDVVPLTGPLDEGQTDLWLLTHSESRHLTRVSAVFTHLSKNLVLD